MEIGITIFHQRNFLMGPGEVPASGYTGVHPGEMERSVLAREEQIRRRIYDLVHEAKKPITFGHPYEIDLSTSYEIRIEKRIPYKYLEVEVVRVPEYRAKAEYPIIHLTWRERFRALFKGVYFKRPTDEV